MTSCNNLGARGKDLTFAAYGMRIGCAPAMRFEVAGAAGRIFAKTAATEANPQKQLDPGSRESQLE